MLFLVVALLGLAPRLAGAGPYGAMYTPAAFSSLIAGKTTDVSVTVRNTGSLNWTPAGSNPVRLSYHWDATGAVPAGSVPTTPAPNHGAVLFNGLWTILPQAIPPGITVPLTT